MFHGKYEDDLVSRGGEFNKVDNDAKIEVTTAEMRAKLEADGVPLPEGEEMVSLSRL